MNAQVVHEIPYILEKLKFLLEFIINVISYNETFWVCPQNFVCVGSKNIGKLIDF